MLIKKRVSKKDCKLGYILDGFPRTLNQVKNIFSTNIKIDCIIEIITHEKTILERISGRLVHENSGRTYHKIFFPPIIKNKDNITGEKLTRRKDDKVKIVKKRLKEYNKEIKKIRKYFIKKISKKKKNYYKIDGNLEKDAITKNIIKIIENI
ncbi:MAG: hypothetical protein BucCj_3050 [Buchnera aphidicola (Ceratovacuna japonica)]